MKTNKMLCPFCSHELEEEMYNGIYGCDTGCEFVNIEIECPNCKKITWDSGKFGWFDEKDDEDYRRYRDEFMEEFAQELERIAKDRLKET